MKTAIVYYSKHHGNTKKLLDEIAKHHEVTLIDAVNEPNADVSEFDRVGFASGIYYSKFNKAVLAFAKEKLRDGQDTFFIFTYSAEKKGYTDAIRQAVSAHKANILGEYCCLGFNTFGPFKLIGGIVKGHPDSKDLSGVVKFYEDLG